MTAADVDERFCPECGYNLRGLGGGRCPECGLEVSGAYVSPIAWEHRGVIGRWKAFWRTVLAVTFRPERVGRAVGGPVDVGAARKFRWIVTAIAGVSAMWFYGRCFGFGEEGIPRALSFDATRQLETSLAWESRVVWAAGASLIPVIPIALIIATGVITRPPVFWFIDDERRPRLKAVGAYACAPLAWSPLGVLTYEVMRLLQGVPENRAVSQILGFVISIMFAVLGFLIIVAWWSPVRIYMRATQGGIGRMALAGVFGLPAAFVFGVAIGFEWFPDLVGLIATAIRSLR